MEHEIVTSMRKFTADATPEIKVGNNKQRTDCTGTNVRNKY